jgi:hypothetical protein
MAEYKIIVEPSNSEVPAASIVAWTDEQATTADDTMVPVGIFAPYTPKEAVEVFRNKMAEIDPTGETAKALLAEAAAHLDDGPDHTGHDHTDEELLDLGQTPLN